jgi:hypothetical protein
MQEGKPIALSSIMSVLAMCQHTYISTCEQLHGSLMKKTHRGFRPQTGVREELPLLHGRSFASVWVQESVCTHFPSKPRCLLQNAHHVGLHLPCGGSRSARSLEDEQASGLGRGSLFLQNCTGTFPVKYCTTSGTPLPEPVTTSVWFKEQITATVWFKEQIAFL